MASVSSSQKMPLTIFITWKLGLWSSKRNWKDEGVIYTRRMDNSLSEELYSESLQLSNLHLGHSSTANGFNESDIQDEDGSLWGSDEELDKASELDREWQRRHDEFHTIGYRDGLIAGKEASAQEGFNIGFKQSVFSGCNWGLVRGITSALACLPDELRERLIETQEKREKSRELYESVNSISTTDALKLFHDDIMTKKDLEQRETTEIGVTVGGSQEQSSSSGTLGNLTAELQSLLLESPQIKVEFFHQQVSSS
ncbi:hypothetical protein CCACVL1_30719 [Corchorus capsularis]|uniref:Essential protein Yae1 N-terminal domain-containing protein n=1 Tax=Corchorus capsularis TaxID=210143 RepID=A0A1R3FVX5_COCAP|nr:hypothetical protein CCACVL1_30719 [Corchorus capsularis]